jgi:hypothetical protein
MAELNGILKFIGTVGDIRVYYNKTLKRYIVSTKGSTPKEVIKKNPAFARQRENMAEFKGCAFWAKLLRSALSDLEHLFGGYYFSGFMSLAKTIQKHDDVGEHGFRAVESSKVASLLSSLVFNKLHPFDLVCSQEIKTVFSSDRKTVTLTLPGFRSYSRLSWPKTIQSYRLALLIAQLSDFYWSVADNCYKPVAPGLQNLSVMVYSDWRKTNTESEDIVLSASFAQPALQQPGTTVLVVLAIEIYVGNAAANPSTPTPLGTMKIVECFV